MPFTPFHLGPALLLGAVLGRRLDLPTLLVSSTIVDVRAALVVFGPLDGPVHGILTTFAGGTGVALLVAGAATGLPQPLRSALDRVRFAREPSTSSVAAAALVGAYSHVVLDSMLYTDARPLFPVRWNPFLLDGARFVSVYAGCVIAGVLGVAIFAVRYRTALAAALP